MSSRANSEDRQNYNEVPTSELWRGEKNFDDEAAADFCTDCSPFYYYKYSHTKCHKPGHHSQTSRGSCASKISGGFQDDQDEEYLYKSTEIKTSRNRLRGKIRPDTPPPPDPESLSKTHRQKYSHDIGIKINNSDKYHNTNNNINPSSSNTPLTPIVGQVFYRPSEASCCACFSSFVAPSTPQNFEFYSIPLIKNDQKPTKCGCNSAETNLICVSRLPQPPPITNFHANDSGSKVIPTSPLNFCQHQQEQAGTSYEQQSSSTMSKFKVSRFSSPPCNNCSFYSWTRREDFTVGPRAKLGSVDKNNNIIDAEILANNQIYGESDLHWSQKRGQSFPEHQDCNSYNNTRNQPTQSRRPATAQVVENSEGQKFWASQWKRQRAHSSSPDRHAQSFHLDRKSSSDFEASSAQSSRTSIESSKDTECNRCNHGQATENHNVITSPRAPKRKLDRAHSFQRPRIKSRQSFIARTSTREKIQQQQQQPKVNIVPYNIHHHHHFVNPSIDGLTAALVLSIVQEKFRRSDRDNSQHHSDRVLKIVSRNRRVGIRNGKSHPIYSHKNNYNNITTNNSDVSRNSNKTSSKDKSQDHEKLCCSKKSSIVSIIKDEQQKKCQDFQENSETGAEASSKVDATDENTENDTEQDYPPERFNYFTCDEKNVLVPIFSLHEIKKKISNFILRGKNENTIQEGGEQGDNEIAQQDDPLISKESLDEKKEEKEGVKDRGQYENLLKLLAKTPTGNSDSIFTRPSHLHIKNHQTEVVVMPCIPQFNPPIDIFRKIVVKKCPETGQHKVIVYKDKRLCKQSRCRNQPSSCSFRCPNFAPTPTAGFLSNFNPYPPPPPPIFPCPNPLNFPLNGNGNECSQFSPESLQGATREQLLLDIQNAQTAINNQLASLLCCDNNCANLNAINALLSCFPMSDPLTTPNFNPPPPDISAPFQQPGSTNTSFNALGQQSPLKIPGQEIGPTQSQLASRDQNQNIVPDFGFPKQVEGQVPGQIPGTGGLVGQLPPNSNAPLQPPEITNAINVLTQAIAENSRAIDAEVAALTQEVVKNIQGDLSSRLCLPCDWAMCKSTPSSEQTGCQPCICQRCPSPCPNYNSRASSPFFSPCCQSPRRKTSKCRDAYVIEPNPAFWCNHVASSPSPLPLPEAPVRGSPRPKDEPFKAEPMKEEPIKITKAPSPVNIPKLEVPPVESASITKLDVQPIRPLPVVKPSRDIRPPQPTKTTVPVDKLKEINTIAKFSKPKEIKTIGKFSKPKFSVDLQLSIQDLPTKTFSITPIEFTPFEVPRVRGASFFSQGPIVDKKWAAIWERRRSSLAKKPKAVQAGVPKLVPSEPKSVQVQPSVPSVLAEPPEVKDAGVDPPLPPRKCPPGDGIVIPLGGGRDIYGSGYQYEARIARGSCVKNRKKSKDKYNCQCTPCTCPPENSTKLTPPYAWEVRKKKKESNSGCKREPSNCNIDSFLACHCYPNSYDCTSTTLPSCSGSEPPSGNEGLIPIQNYYKPGGLENGGTSSKVNLRATGQQDPGFGSVYPGGPPLTELEAKILQSLQPQLSRITPNRCQREGSNICVSQCGMGQMEQMGRQLGRNNLEFCPGSEVIYLQQGQCQRARPSPDNDGCRKKKRSWQPCPVPVFPNPRENIIKDPFNAIRSSYKRKVTGCKKS